MTVHPGRDRQALLAQERRVEQLALIARAVVAEHRHDGLARPQLARQPDRAGDVDAGRAAHAPAPRLDQVEDRAHHLLVGDPVGVVDRQALEVGGDPALADALGDRGALGLQLAVRCSSCRAPRRPGRPGRWRRSGFCVAQAMRDAGQRAAGADRADEAVDLAVGLRPDLRAGGVDVGLAVGDVVELVGPDRAGGLLRRQLLGQAAGIAARSCSGSRRGPRPPRPARRPSAGCASFFSWLWVRGMTITVR